MNPVAVEALVGQIEAKDRLTAAHTWRVVLYARAMAETAGLDEHEVERITHAAALHDLGKLDIPDAILQKPGPLDAAEFAIIKTHAARGHERLTDMGERDALVLALVRHHHERMDGTGYPDGLRGEAIPLAARHFAVIDAFDAMTSIRPYRSSVGPEAAQRALTELAERRGPWYCEASVDMFTTLYRSGTLGWILEYCNDRCPLPAYQKGSKAVRRASPMVMRQDGVAGV
ncbi:MAG: HD-GYP domain-containing protein [Phycisphaerales bacterium]